MFDLLVRLVVIVHRAAARFTGRFERPTWPTRSLRINWLPHLGAHRAEVFVDRLVDRINVRDEALLHRGPSELTADPVREHLRLFQPRLHRVQLRVRVSVHVIPAAGLPEDIGLSFRMSTSQNGRHATSYPSFLPQTRPPRARTPRRRPRLRSRTSQGVAPAQVLLLLHRRQHLATVSPSSSSSSTAGTSPNATASPSGVRHLHDARLPPQPSSRRTNLAARPSRGQPS